MSDYSLKLSDVEITRYRMMAQAAFAAERDLWEAAGIRPGAKVADVGCGPGAISAVIAQVVAPGGQVWGVDRDPDALDIGRATDGSIRFERGDATASGLEPGGFDAVMMRHVLAHNGGREQAIVDHLATLVRPGGCVYLADVEASGLRIRPPIAGLEELDGSYRRFHEERRNDLSVGLRLAELLAAAGLETVEFRGRYDIIPIRPGMRPPPWAARAAMVEAGIVDQATVELWQAAFDAYDRAPHAATLFVPIFCAVGRRPA